MTPLAGMLILDRLGVRLRPMSEVLAPAWEERALATGRPVPPLEDGPCEVPCPVDGVQCRGCAAAYGAGEEESER